MAATAGICTQTTTCQVAKSGRIVAIPLGESFVCPECGNGLAPPTQMTPAPVVKRNSSVVPLALVGVGLFILGGAIFVGRELGGGGSAPAPALAVRTPVVAPPAVAPPAPATVASVTPAPTPVAPPAPAPATAPPATVATMPPAVAPGTSVASVPASAPPGTPLPILAPVPVPTQTASLPPPPVSPFPVVAPPAKTPAQNLALTTPPPPPATPMPEPPPPVAALPPDAPFSPVPETGGAPTYPAELAADGRVGKVNVSCQISVDGTPTGCRAATRSGPAFATAVTAWLTHGHVKFHPIILHGHPLAATRTWTVTLEEPAAVLAEARRKQKEEAAAAAAAPAQTASNNLRPQTAPVEPIRAPVQNAMARQVVPSVSSGGGPDVPFSSHTIAGGVPTFPAYYDEGRPGAVTVSCTIEANGSPSGCHIVRQLGGSGFGKAVDQWLGSGRVRFRPILVNGQPVSKQETWTVIFNSMPQPAFGQ